MSRRVNVIGVGMTKFEKPGRREGWDYPDMARESGTKALDDAGVDVQAAGREAGRRGRGPAVVASEAAGAQQVVGADEAVAGLAGLLAAQPVLDGDRGVVRVQTELIDQPAHEGAADRGDRQGDGRGAHDPPEHPLVAPRGVTASAKSSAWIPAITTICAPLAPGCI